MDHEELIRELPIIVEKMTPAERIQLARERRQIQLAKSMERERVETLPTSRIIRLKFRAEIALLEATSRNDVAEVERLLADGAYPNSHNEDGLTPLHQCAIDNNETILLLLLKYGADVNAQDTEQWTPLHAAACCAHKNIVRHLIDHGANLMSVNADGNMPYDICDDDNTLDLIESEMAKQGITQDHIDNERGAAERKMLADMKLLHQNQHPLDYREDDGATALHVAAAHGFYDVAAFLLRCGVSPNVRDNDLWQPMHAAACWAQADLIELLAEYGADVNAKTNSGETALDLCEDESTRAVIATLQAEAARRKRIAFGARDSRRQSRKKKAFSKFESPQQPQSDSPFSARGAIRRLSLRDKSGITLARIDTQREGKDLQRSLSLDDDLAQTSKNANLAANGQATVVSPHDVNPRLSGKKDSARHRPGGRAPARQAGADEWRMAQGAGGAKPVPDSPEMDARPGRGGASDGLNGGDLVKRYAAPKDTVIEVNGDGDRRCGRCCVIS